MKKFVTGGLILLTFYLGLIAVKEASPMIAISAVLMCIATKIFNND